MNATLKRARRDLAFGLFLTRAIGVIGLAGVIGVIGVIGMIGACARAPSAQFAASPAGEPAADAPFSLEPGDVIQTKIWHEKDLSDTNVVDESGRVTLPMLGVVTVLGRPWVPLRDSLIAEYQRQLKNPSVVLRPFRRVQVLGNVTKSGEYYADPTLSIAGVVALAGGASPEGDLRHVRVVRHGKTIVESASVESLLLQSAVHSGDQIFVDRRSWLERNGAIAASTLISATGILVTILHR